MSSILDRILRTKAEEVKRLRRDRPLQDLEDEAREQPAARGFAERIAEADAEAPALIAEFKRASPSKGPIRAGADAAERATRYQEAGARCMSVLTDAQYFSGSLADLRRARAACDLPVLRKDFTIDPIQVLEARAAGADAVLLIVAALGNEQLGELLGAADEAGLDALVEVHGPDELDRALDRGARLVGVNNRDLRTFVTSLEVTERLAAEAPPDLPLVAESGIHTRSDVKRVVQAGARGILVGEALMVVDDPAERIHALLGTKPSS